ncbi:MAG: hypothetical protein EA384_08775 [Spirochaetaceae bacterium]|nr:MAG: hypothetical protein EA384_08775 [Spirochaetaceae bacterium]
MKNSSRTIGFAGQTIELGSERTLLWRDKELLVAADLHLGRRLALETAGHGEALSVDIAALQRLARVARESQVRRLLILGDFVHGAEAVAAPVIRVVADWRKTVSAEVLLVHGSYDHLPAPLLNRWDIEPVGDVLSIAPLLFRYKPAAGHPEPQICGHLHPCARLSKAADSMKLPCFVVEPNLLLMPSFGNHPDGYEISEKDNRVFYVISDGEVRPI